MRLQQTQRSFTREAGRKVADIGAAFQLDEATAARGAEVGLDFYSFYGLGRAGAMGDAEPDVVAAAQFFIERGLVRAVWGPARERVDPRAAARAWADALHCFGRQRFAAIADIARLSELAGRIIEAADASALALFAAWKAMLLPDDPPARTMQQLYVLREFRGACHALAVRVVGLSAFEAIVANDGEALARLFGWQGDTPDADAVRDRVARAEDLTDDLVAPAFGALSDDERALFAGVLDACHTATGGAVEGSEAAETAVQRQRSQSNVG